MDKKDNRCAICILNLDHNYNNIPELKCGHSFHEKCITQWSEVNDTCPICRQQMLVKVTKNNVDFWVPFNFNDKFSQFLSSFPNETSKFLIIQALLAINKKWAAKYIPPEHVQCDSFIDNNNVLHKLIITNMTYSNTILTEASICFDTFCL